MRIMVDFDGVMHQNDPPTLAGGASVEMALDAVSALLAAGHDVIVHTSKARDDTGTSAVKAWLSRHGLGALRVTSTKLPADVYLDDKAMRFTTWDNALRDLASL